MRNGVELWALTDHDELAGLQRARDAALDLGMASSPAPRSRSALPAKPCTSWAWVSTPTTRPCWPAWPPPAAAAAQRALEMAEGLAKVGLPGRL
jgi:hypothetical protein